MHGSRRIVNQGWRAVAQVQSRQTLGWHSHTQCLSLVLNLGVHNDWLPQFAVREQDA